MSDYLVYQSDQLSTNPPHPHLLKDVCRTTGSVLLFGRTGIGKTRLLWQCACAWANGEAIFGIAPAHSLKIAFVEADMLAPEMEDFVKELAAVGVKPSSNIRLVMRRDTDNFTLAPGSPFYQWIRAQHDAWGTDLTIFDAIIDLHDGDSNSQETAARMLQRLRIAAGGRAYIGTFAQRKLPPTGASDDATGDEMLGSQGWGRQAHTVIQMTNTPSLVYQKTRLCKKRAAVHLLITDDGLFTERYVDLAGAIILASNGGYKSKVELARKATAGTHFRMSERTVLRHIDDLIARGSIPAPRAVDSES